MLRLTPALLLIAASPAPAPDQRDFTFGSFERVRVEGPFDVALGPGSPRASVLGSAASVDRVSVRVEGDTLVVSAGTFARSSAGDPLPRVLVTGPAPRAVLVNGGGTVRIAEMRGARVEASLSGTGSLEVAAMRADELISSLAGTGAIRFAGTAGRVRLRNIGTGSIDAQGLTANDADIASQSSGITSLAVRYTVRASALGTGGISIAGKPECTLSGPGPITCDGRVVRR